MSDIGRLAVIDVRPGEIGYGSIPGAETDDYVELQRGDVAVILAEQDEPKQVFSYIILTHHGTAVYFQRLKIL